MGRVGEELERVGEVTGIPLKSGSWVKKVHLAFCVLRKLGAHISVVSGSLQQSEYSKANLTESFLAAKIFCIVSTLNVTFSYVVLTWFSYAFLS